MKNRIVKYILLFLYLLLLSSCSDDNGGLVAVTPETIAENSTLNTILKRGKLIVGMDIADIRYQPFEMKDANGKIIGFDADLAQMMADELNVTLEIVESNWDGIISDLVNKKFDIIISGMSITTERNKAINFSRPYYLSGKCLLVNIEYAGRVMTYHDLNRPGVVVTTTFHDDMVLDRYLPDATIVRHEKADDAALEVSEGRAQAFIVDKALLATFAKKYPDTTFSIVTPFTYEPVAMGTRKGDPDLLNWINNFIEIISGDGRLALLEQKWMLEFVPAGDLEDK
ncbi:MAG: transporter substrate-binding domain-containing protein [Deltaproteobacteria bacterium]|uniref:Transporter substrate-binding domain-containing protein n=1 Tax=Candidatus Zymogenus saltonus TaxID=2844893 RepID=A0A9D8KFD2_9DELT|nr:transporter substrate-binding domain-containing protein [Candidatus Zymogenus saltonus]